MDTCNYVGEDIMVGRYLETLKRPDGISDSEYQQLRRKAKKYLVRDGYLFRRGRKRGFPPRRVVGLEDQKKEVIQDICKDYVRSACTGVNITGCRDKVIRVPMSRFLIER